MSASIPNQLSRRLLIKMTQQAAIFFPSIPDISLVWRLSDIYSLSSIKSCHLGEIGYYIIILLCFALRHLSFLRTKDFYSVVLNKLCKVVFPAYEEVI